MKTLSEIIKETKQSIAKIFPVNVNNKIKTNEQFILVDVREKDEVSQGYIKGSINIPRGSLEIKIEGVIPERDTPIIVYCASGVRSAMATKTLKEMGYKNVLSMTGGFTKWKEEKLDFVKDEIFNFTPEQVSRYSRQVLLPEVSEKGQINLLKSKVLIVGAGGLGSPVGYYLAAAGVGTLGVVDADKVDLSNLHRQILHSTSNVGKPKVLSAKESINRLNPDVNVVTYEDRLTSENAIEIISQYNLVIDGTDNFATKYLINDACYFTGKPNIYGSIFKFEGQLTVFDTKYDSPCYRCLFPTPPSPELSPSCSEVGVLGVLSGVVGTLQAVEAIKLILGKGESLMGKLLIYDSLNTSFRNLKIKKDNQCSLCGDNKTITELIDYENFCSV